MTTVYLYRFFCNTENTYVTVWGTEAPTACPHNTSDSINLTTLQIVQTIAPQEVIITTDNTNTNGQYRGMGFTYDVNAGPDTTFQIVGEKTFQYYIRIYSFNVFPAEENIGDTFSFVAARNTVIGLVISPVASGNVISVDNNVFVHIAVGFEVTLKSENIVQVLGECVHIDALNNQITVELPITNSFPIGSMLMITVKRIENFTIRSTQKLLFGENLIGSTLIPPGMKGTLLYKNATSNAKKISLEIEMTY